MKSDISQVVRSKLCAQCGFCAAVCPTGAVSVVPDRWSNLFPRVDAGSCTSCGLCLDVCPGVGWDPAADEPGSPAGLGPCLTISSGHAADGTLRRRASSGGAVTAALLHMLEEGRIAGAVVVRGGAGAPLRGESHLARTREEILEACGSWYLPAGMERGVREALAAREPVAVAGLPCHLQAWRKAEGRLPELGRRVALRVGLFCDHLVDARFTLLLARLFGAGGELSSVRFRGEGWPGSIRVTPQGGEERRIPYGHPLRKLLWKSYFFTPRRCLLCSDALSEAADISCGDPWLPEFAAETEGASVIVGRTPRGEAVLREMEARGRLVLEPLSAERLARSQRVQLVMKKREIGARLRLARLLGGAVPESGPRPRASAAGWAMGAAAMSLAALSRAGWFWPVARRLPWRATAGLWARGRGGAG